MEDPVLNVEKCLGMKMGRTRKFDCITLNIKFEGKRAGEWLPALDFCNEDERDIVESAVETHITQKQIAYFMSGRAAKAKNLNEEVCVCVCV